MVTTEFVAIVLAVGGLLPILTAVVNQPHWSTRARTIMSVLVSVLAGLVAYVAEFGFVVDSPSSIVATVVGVVLAAATAYKTLWQPTGVAPAIEAATSKTPQEVDAG